MDAWEFIKPDRRILALFILLFLLSILLSTFVKGYDAGGICRDCSGQSDECDWSGLGLPFTFLDVGFICAHCTWVSGENGVRTCETPAESLVRHELIDVVNFVLDIIIFYAAAFILVRAYDSLFKKEGHQRRARK